MTFISLTLYKGPHFIQDKPLQFRNMRVTFLILLLVAMIVVASARWGSDSSFSDTGRREKTDSGTSRRRTTSSESSPGRPVSPDRRRRLVTPDRRRRRVDGDCGFPRPVPMKARVSVTGTSVGSVAYYWCYSGLVLIGNPIRVCTELSNGRARWWPGRTPRCRSRRYRAG